MTTIIVGGGWSGLAAAVRLLEQGESVHLIESAKQLGGRARNVSWNEQTIDNGQHLLIGAYQQTLKLLQDIGAE
ncbi:NAD(P)-binding protein, partial [Methylophaga sp. UBA3996]